MASYKAIVNPFTGNLTLIRADSAFHLKDGVDTYNDLPLIDNTENDVRITKDTDKMYTWGISSSSGLLTDWKEIGQSTAVDWSAITGKPSSTPAQIDTAVSDTHTQNADTKLDEGGANEVSASDVKDAVDKKHEHSNKALLDTYTQTEVDIADAISKEHSHSNKSELDLVSDGDHDVRTDNPHSVDKSDVSLGNVPNLDTTDAVNNEHVQNTDTTLILDTTPDSDTTAHGIKGTFTAGENVAFGDVCYIKNDGKMWKGDADSETTTFTVAMALGTINADASGTFLLIGIVRDDSWNWTVGSPVFLSTTSGDITQTAPSGSGDIVQILGVATHADRIYFNPNLVQVEIA